MVSMTNNEWLKAVVDTVSAGNKAAFSREFELTRPTITNWYNVSGKGANMRRSSVLEVLAAVGDKMPAHLRAYAEGLPPEPDEVLEQKPTLAESPDLERRVEALEEVVEKILANMEFVKDLLSPRR